MRGVNHRVNTNDNNNADRGVNINVNVNSSTAILYNTEVLTLELTPQEIADIIIIFQELINNKNKLKLCYYLANKSCATLPEAAEVLKLSKPAILKLTKNSKFFVYAVYKASREEGGRSGRIALSKFAEKHKDVIMELAKRLIPENELRCLEFVLTKEELRLKRKFEKQIRDGRGVAYTTLAKLLAGEEPYVFGLSEKAKHALLHVVSEKYREIVENLKNYKGEELEKYIKGIATYYSEIIELPNTKEHFIRIKELREKIEKNLKELSQKSMHSHSCEGSKNF